MGQCQVRACEEDHARPGWTTSRRGQCQSEWQRTEINGESTSGSRTAKEQNRCHVYVTIKINKRTAYLQRAYISVSRYVKAISLKSIKSFQSYNHKCTSTFLLITGLYWMLEINVFFLFFNVFIFKNSFVAYAESLYFIMLYINLLSVLLHYLYAD